MARKERNDVDYFPHTVNHGKKMYFIRSKYKNDGYAVWFMLVEELGKAEYHYLNLSDDVSIMYLSSSMMVSEELLISIINDLVKLGEFDKNLWEEERILFNEKFVNSIQDAYKKRNNKCVDKNSLLLLLTSKGILKRPKSIPLCPKSTSKGYGNTQTKVKDSKEKKNIEKESENFRNSEPIKSGNNQISLDDKFNLMIDTSALEYTDDEKNKYAYLLFEEFTNNVSLIDDMMRSLEMDKSEVIYFIQKFIQVQKVEDRLYRDFPEMRRHCSRWIRSNVKSNVKTL